MIKDVNFVRNMKNLFFVVFAGLGVILAGCSMPSGGNSEPDGLANGSISYPDSNSVEQTFTDSNRIVYNPDIGFYSVIDAKVTRDGISELNSVKSQITESAGLYNGTYFSSLKFNLIHLKVDISDFSTLGYKRPRNSDNAIEKAFDKREDDIREREEAGLIDEPLTQKALSDINAMINAFRGSGKTVIIRFCYNPDFGGESYIENGKEVFVDVEPSDIDTITNHVQQICSVLKNYEDVITAIECGMVGPWGEMHSTTAATTSGNIEKVMTKFLDELESTNIPFLVRQPAFIYDYLGLDHSSSVPSYNVSKNSKAYKIGLYNDGYLGSSSDSGTYKLTRSNEINFCKQFTNHTPYGGEMIGKYRIDAANNFSGLSEMFDVHLSFLNIGWNENVFIDLHNNVNYNNENCFDYIIKHMGYRFVLRKSLIAKSADLNNLKIKLQIQNNGFGNLPMHRNKTVKIIITDSETGSTVKTVTLRNKFKSTEEKNITIETEDNEIDISSLTNGKTYKVFVKLSNSDDNYPIEFANPSSNWNSELKANYAGTFIK